jgi:hypothetical protein
MDRGAYIPVGLGDNLTFINPLADAHNRLGRRPYVLLEGNN